MPLPAVSDDTFGREVLGSTLPVLVEFGAESIAAQATTPALDDVALALRSRIKVLRLDVERNQALKAEYEIRGIPTLILFKGGKPLARRIGGRMPKEEIEEWVDAQLILALATRRTSAGRNASVFKISNGMDVVVIPDRRAPIVTHMVWYKIGAADEPKGHSGIARLVEHLTFKSLEKYSACEFSKVIFACGGQSNAFSNRDVTTYWQRVTRDQLKVVMEMEVDRMLQLRLSEEELATERKVIMELRRSLLDTDPAAALEEKIGAALYRGHRNGIPVVGSASEIARLTRDDVLRFHELHYVPDNAVLVVSGDVEAQDVKLLAEETYGRIPAAGKLGKPARSQVPVHIAARRVALENSRTGASRFRRDYAVPSYVGPARRRGERSQGLVQR